MLFDRLRICMRCLETHQRYIRQALEEDLLDAVDVYELRDANARREYELIDALLCFLVTFSNDISAPEIWRQVAKHHGLDIDR